MGGIAVRLCWGHVSSLAGHFGPGWFAGGRGPVHNESAHRWRVAGRRGLPLLHPGAEAALWGLRGERAEDRWAAPYCEESVSNHKLNREAAPSICPDGNFNNTFSPMVLFSYIWDLLFIMCLCIPLFDVLFIFLIQRKQYVQFTEKQEVWDKQKGHL